MFEVTQLFFYKVVFVVELMVSELLFSFRLRKRKHYPLRYALSAIAMIGIAFLFPLFGLNSAYYTSFVFLSLFGISFALSFFLYDETATTLLFCAVAAYSLQHLAYLTYTITCNIFGVDLKTIQGIYLETKEYSYNPTSFGVYFVCYSVVYWAGYILFARRISGEGGVPINNVFMLVLSGVLIVSEILVNAVITYESYVDYNVTFIVSGKIAGIVSCLLALSLQFTLSFNKNLEEELDRTRRLSRQERRQYEISKSSIDVINKKCHDLKYQIRTIGKERIVESGVIKEIESAISIYDSAVKTGNAALDTIIREKTLYCNAENISLTCMLNGTDLDFMKETDVYTLFGNALDNAIEAVQKLDEKHRVITVTGSKNENLVSVGIANYCLNPPEFQGGIPKTTKENREYHGFGVRSIRDIVEKYGGNLSITVKDGVFRLDMLFFLSEIAK